MGSAVVEKTEAELRKEIDELHHQQRDITARLRDPRGIRRGGLFGNVNRQRGFVRPHGRNEIEDQPAPKKRLLSAVVKLEEGEIDDDDDAVKDSENKDFAAEQIVEGIDVANRSERKTSGWPRTVGDQQPWKMDSEFPPVEHVPRVLPKEEDPSLVKRNKRMLGQLLGTLEVIPEWKAARREELSQNQKQLTEQYVANVGKELERWQNGRNARNGRNNALNLQETMDQELETHRLEHGPKRRKIPGGSNNEDEDDVEDINVGEDDMIDDVLDDENRELNKQ